MLRVRKIIPAQVLMYSISFQLHNSFQAPILQMQKLSPRQLKGLSAHHPSFKLVLWIKGGRGKGRGDPGRKLSNHRATKSAKNASSQLPRRILREQETG